MRNSVVLRNVSRLVSCVVLSLDLIETLFGESPGEILKGKKTILPSMQDGQQDNRSSNKSPDFVNVSGPLSICIANLWLSNFSAIRLLLRQNAPGAIGRQPWMLS